MTQWVCLRRNFDALEREENITVVAVSPERQAAKDACDAHYHLEFDDVALGPAEPLIWQDDDTQSLATVDMCCGGGYYRIEEHGLFSGT